MKTKAEKLQFAFAFSCLGLCVIILGNLFAPLVFAVSADVTLRGNGNEIECDTTQRTATVQTNNLGCSIYNKSSGSVWVDLNAGTVVTSNGSTSIEVAQSTSYKLPKTCYSFTFKTAGGTSYLQWIAP